MKRLSGAIFVFILSLLIWGTVAIGSDLPFCKLISTLYNQTPDMESIELLFNTQPEYETFYLEHPDRFVIDIKNSYFPKIKDALSPNSEHIKTIRISQFQPDRVRLVIDQKIATQVNIRKKDLPTGTLLILTPGFAESPETQKNASSSDGMNSISGASDPEPVKDDSSGPDPKTDNLSLTGELKNETAYRTKKPHQFSKIKNSLNLKASGSLSKKVSFVLGARVSYDPVFDLTDNYNDRVEKDQRVMADLRDAYLDMDLENFDLRIGNQQIVWGQAVGLFFADIVNPLNLKEYILPDLEQLRTPVPALNLEYFGSDFNFQTIFIPFPEFNKFGKAGSEFDFSKQIYAQNVDIILNDPADPSNSLDNSEIGFRMSKLIHGWDMSLFYLYDMYNFPVNYRFISLNPPGSSHPVTITYQPKYERVHRTGATFSKDYEDAIFKGEFIYSNDLYFPSSDIADLDGIKASDTFDWLLGVDYTFFGRLETNFQLMQNIILDHDPDMIQKEYKTSFSVWMKIGFFDNKIEPELFFVSSFNQKDYLLRPKISYHHSGSLKFTLGADMFYGEEDGDLGIFRNNDRLYIETVYKF